MLRRMSDSKASAKKAYGREAARGAKKVYGSEDARRIHAECPALDLHTDSFLWTRLGGYDVNARHQPPLPASALFGHVDVPRALDGGLGGAFFGLVALPWLDRASSRAIDTTIALIERTARESDGKLRIVRSAEELEAARVDGVVAAMMGIEGAHALEGDIDAIGAFAKRGARYLGLLHFTSNECGAPMMGWGQDRDKGLTTFGGDLVAKCEEVGVIVDLAHINERGLLDACALAKKPMIVSHTGLAGVHESWRNISDAQLRAVAETGGVAGVIFCPRYLGRDGIDAVVDHLLHVVDVAGEDAAALGSDWDGFIVPTRGLDEASKLPLLTDALLARKVPERVVRKILRENTLRVVRDVPPRAVHSVAIADG